MCDVKSWSKPSDIVNASTGKSCRGCPGCVTRPRKPRVDAPPSAKKADGTTRTEVRLMTSMSLNGSASDLSRVWRVQPQPYSKRIERGCPTCIRTESLSPESVLMRLTCNRADQPNSLRWSRPAPPARRGGADSGTPRPNAPVASRSATPTSAQIAPVRRPRSGCHPRPCAG